jgi:hypothetical protein
MNLTLSDLDQAFDNLWEHQNQLPELLEVWQGMVLEFLDTVHPETPNKSEVAERVYYWEAVITHYNCVFSDYYEATTVH